MESERKERLLEDTASTKAGRGKVLAWSGEGTSGVPDPARKLSRERNGVSCRDGEHQGLQLPEYHIPWGPDSTP